MSESSDRYYPGKGCKCGAWSAVECGCDNIDWRSSREVELESLIMRYEAALQLIAAPKRPDGTYNRDREACRELAEKALKGKP